MVSIGETRCATSEPTPGKSPNKTRTPTAEEMEGKGLANANLGQQNAFRTRTRADAPSELAQIQQKAKSNKDVKFTALMHRIYRIDTLRFACPQLKRHTAAGVDEETWRHYGEALSSGRKCHAAPVCGIHRMPSKVLRFDAGERPRPSCAASVRLTADQSTITAHLSKLLPPLRHRSSTPHPLQTLWSVRNVITWQSNCRL